MRIFGNKAYTEIWMKNGEFFVGFAVMDRSGKLFFFVSKKDGSNFAMVHDPKESAESLNDLCNFARQIGDANVEDTAKKAVEALDELKKQLSFKREKMLNLCQSSIISAIGFIRFMTGSTEFFLPINGKNTKIIFFSRLDFGRELGWKHLIRVRCNEKLEITGAGASPVVPIFFPPGEYEIYEGDENQIGITQNKGEYL